jgi:hypothetical protein
MNRFSSLFIRLFAITAFWMALAYFDLIRWYILLPLFLLLFLYFYLQMRIADNEIYFELICNTTLYLRRLEDSKEAKNDTDLYHLGLAYAAIYQDDLDRATEELGRIDEGNLSNPARHVPILIRVRARVAAHAQEQSELEDLKIRAKEMALPQLGAYIEALQLEADQKWEELAQHIETWMPTESIRLHLLELERLLAIAYLNLGRIDEAKAVLSATVKRGCGTYHTDWAYETYLKYNETE